MTAEIVNLRRVRKGKARAARAAAGAANRARFGRSKSERQREEAERGLDRRRLDGLERLAGRDGRRDGADAD
jgi:hypothetical protein